MRDIKFLGRVIVRGKISTVTGLHIGGSPGALAIGGVDMPVARDPLTGRPYIPGSSLKGKMRSLAEKSQGAPQNTPIKQGDRDGRGRVEIHTAKTQEEYDQYWVNPIFGITGDAGFTPAPTRLVVRDVPLDPKSAEELLALKTDMPYTEVKWEAAIDRVTSAATPRQIERVPAGALFGPMELVLSVYLPDDIALFDHVLTCLQLVEDDYLGGQGSRGSGKVEFQKLDVICKRGDTYKEEKDARFAAKSLAELVAARADLKAWLKQTLNVT